MSQTTGSHFQFNRENLAPFSVQPAPVQQKAKVLVVIDGGDGDWGAKLAKALRQARPDVQLWPIGLTPEAHAAMFAALAAEEKAPPGDILDRAAGVFAPSDLVLPGGAGGELALDVVQALARSAARIVLMPPQDPRLRWLAAPDWPQERWIENAVIEAGNLVEQGAS